ncbi:MAG: DUF3489 domain-containing protein [Hyphomicrobium sp.]|nr:DUF3489 domain-containing protein [Hyphomicrobium sp.]
MTTIEARAASQTKRATPSTLAKAAKAKAIGTSTTAKLTSVKNAARDDVHAARVTKHDRILTLLSRREGATVPEMMEATGWQQHSVRGFLAGTVKKKLGFTMASSKAPGELRRYRIEAKRGR